ncbi:NADPH-dependent 2,4-dienoyl-CoA reductase, sulfur reductase [Halopenitus malekzadehii]|uniref:NADPH-dependent 2,4-dienoyl-CoA reductase, sulfur reductase n=1 Tax=Halopenitus malekzadehii TaxID=1267564 RepID=A0A1H6HQT7_9EURY|nr:FAD-dependent oxidoreductase [Halopenitus malekzadehii]SEH36480.1 NADPH-dependent 2,4-dienoyl-CoA reductase, sulfur reductase [Halopenitus malekzadehii]
MTDPFVVIGGDAAGLSAASKLKRERPDRDVIVFEKGSWVSYAQCGMPYYVKGEVESLRDLLSLTPEAVADRGIDLRRRHEVVAVNTADRTVTVESESTRFERSYGDLIVATGAHAVADPIAGGDLTGAFTMHSMDAAAALRAFLTPPNAVGTDIEKGGVVPDLEYVDAERVERYAEMEPPTGVAIVGGGYVGVEMAEAFSAHDLDVHLFQRPDRLLPEFGQAVGETVEATLVDHGVDVRIGTEVERLAGTDRVEAVVTADERVSVDLALIGIGVRPNAGIVDDTPIERGASGAIATDEYGRTTAGRVFAAGDCAEMRHAVTGEPDWVPLGLTANRAGRAIGSTVAGDPTPVGEIAGTAAVKAFDQECGRTGILDHGRAREAGFDPVSETVTAGSRSGYYPGAAETTVTLTADRETGRLLGGSIVGTDRAAIRIDTLATALESDLTVPKLERLDLAYAPPFSPVWDPVLVAAKVLNGRLSDAE